MKIRRIIQDYFTFNRNERIGISILLSIVLILIIVRHFLFYFEVPGEADLKQFNLAVAEMNKQQKMKFKEKNNRKLFVFDPNEIDSLGLDSLNIPYFVKSNLLRYRKRGGNFNSVESFRKIYGVNDSIFKAIENYISINKISKVKRKPERLRIETKQFPAGKEKTIIEQIDLNTADSLLLKTLPGIGNKLSKRIVKYRDLLGGYYSVEQLSEVYGLKESVLSKIVPLIIIDSTKIRRLDLNFSDKTTLLRHPYLSYSQVMQIIDFRNSHGFINDAEVLIDSLIIEQKDFQKLVPYIKIEHLQKFVKKMN